MKGVDVEEGTSRPGSGTTLVMEAAKRSVTWCDMSACLSITLFRLSSIRRRVLKIQITTAMQISRISQYHNVQNGEDTLFKTCRTNYAVAVCRNRLLFVKEHSFRYHYLIVLNFMLYYINEHHSWNVVEKYAMQKNRKNDYIFLQ